MNLKTSIILLVFTSIASTFLGIGFKDFTLILTGSVTILWTSLLLIPYNEIHSRHGVKQ